MTMEALPHQGYRGVEGAKNASRFPHSAHSNASAPPSSISFSFNFTLNLNKTRDEEGKLLSTRAASQIASCRIRPGQEALLDGENEVGIGGDQHTGPCPAPNGI